MKQTRIEREKRVVEYMVQLYCKKKENNAELCPSCKAVIEYAHSRLDRCRFGEEKPTCKVCPIHCYKPEMKERIREIMRFAGPRIILYHPIIAIRHAVSELLFTPKSKVE